MTITAPHKHISQNDGGCFMKQITKITCIILAVLLLISAVACEKSQTEAAQQTTIDPLEGVITEEEYNVIQTRINDIVQETHMNLLPYSGYMYFFEREQSDKLSEAVGYKGLPVLITEIEKKVEAEENYLHCAFCASTVYALLRIDELSISDRESPEYRNCTKKAFYSLYTNAKTQISDILKKEISTNEKISALRRCGIIAVPYVMSEIEKGNTEFEKYFTAIGLHMETPEYMIYMSDRDRLWEHGFEQEGFMDGAEDFDYKVWYEENEEDLDNLFKFLDAYCAEYEAEQNKKIS